MLARKKVKFSEKRKLSKEEVLPQDEHKPIIKRLKYENHSEGLSNNSFFSSTIEEKETLTPCQVIVKNKLGQWSALMEKALAEEAKNSSSAFKVNEFLANFISLVADFYILKEMHMENGARIRHFFVMLDELYSEASRFDSNNEIVNKMKNVVRKDGLKIFKHRSRYVSEDQEKESLAKDADISSPEKMILVFNKYLEEHFIQLETIIFDEERASEIVNNLFLFIEEKTKEIVLAHPDIFQERSPSLGIR